MKTITVKFIFALLAILSFVLVSCEDDNVEYKLPSDGKCTIEFDLNYSGATGMPSSMKVLEGEVLELNAKPIPSRDGYRFAGWYTNKECKPDQEWLFGYKSGGYFSSVTDSMSVNESMTLYARWVSPIHIKDATELNTIREDLYGWYILDNDIDLSAFSDWEPIGEYDGSYEFADGEWWAKAFKGKFDGQGYSISNLNLTSANKQMKALFGTVANGEIANVVINNCEISLSAPTIYTAPLIGVLKEDAIQKALVKNCKVTNTKIDVKLNYNPGVFSSITGLVAGSWNGTIEDCHVDGTMQLIAEGSGIGELYIGGIAGEAYCNTVRCSSDLDISTNTKANNALKVFIGGLQASATNIQNSLASGDISFEGSTGIEELYIGGLVGSERYGIIQNCASHGDISVNNSPIAQIAGIVGEFSETYGGMGAAFGIKLTELKNCYASGNVTINNVVSLTQGGISGSGQPEPLNAWGGTMDYFLADCAYIASPEQILSDKDVSALHRYSSVDELEGTAIQSILDNGDGAGHWSYSGSLPIPDMTKK